MKKHAIIPIFIPHLGCPNDCVFCNQKIITARSASPDESMVAERIEAHLATLRGRGLETVEVAFFGGSFTGLPMEEQRAYLAIAERYKRAGDIDKIRLSTRPDYIHEEILCNLVEQQVDIVELGVQSFYEEVLALSCRGHGVEEVYDACGEIRKHGLLLGIQLMIGLPGDSPEKSIASARSAASLSPDFARLYPTVILQDTELARLYKAGRYLPFSREEMLYTTKEMYKVLLAGGATILRVGLKSTDLVTTGSDLGGDYHPAFRQLVEGEIAREQMDGALKNLPKGVSSVTFSSSERWFSAMIGHKGCNKKTLKERHSSLEIRYEKDPCLEDGVVKLSQ